MKSTCIEHPKKEPLVVIRKWQLEACRDNACAAALLSFFEYWHNIRIEMAEKARTANQTAEKHGDNGTQDTSLWQFHTEKELEDGILIYGRTAISDGIKLLQKLGFVDVGLNPNPRYKFDRTRFFLFNDKAVSDWIVTRKTDSGESSPVSGSRQTVSGSLSPETGSAITETTYETSLETVKPSPAKKRGEPTTNNNDEGKLFTLTSPAEIQKSLHARLRTHIQKWYEQENQITCPWDASESKQLSELLKGNSKIDELVWFRCVDNRFKSDVNQADRPRKWISSLHSYAKGSLDEYGKLRQVRTSYQSDDETITERMKRTGLMRDRRGE